MVGDAEAAVRGDDQVDRVAFPREPGEERAGDALVVGVGEDGDDGAGRLLGGNGSRHRARLFVTAIGPLSAPTMRTRAMSMSSSSASSSTRGSRRGSTSCSSGPSSA